VNVHGLRAAEGWIELDNFDQAAEELHNCAPAIKSSVEWIKLWIRIYSAKQHWREVEMMCETLVKHAPEDPFTIFNQVEAFHKQGRSREAFAALQYAPTSVKQGADFFYLMARILCALQEYTLALSCIGKATDTDPSIRMKALNDPDLERVWLDVQEG
jgi:tetratricopeptide (TPR) repeat protein